ncbi:MAG: DUF3052 family protein [Gemmatimonadota bacterium]|nr:DUF3052 family protein [Gemmatimonadota bacterium]
MTERSYAHRDVLDKLGIGPRTRVRLEGDVPEDLAERIREGARVVHDKEGVDLVVWRIESLAEAEAGLEAARRRIVDDGGVWILTAKRGHDDYVKQTDLIPVGKAAGLVDNKVCSVDESTSAMRFVIPRERR